MKKKKKLGVSQYLIKIVSIYGILIKTIFAIPAYNMLFATLVCNNRKNYYFE